MKVMLVKIVIVAFGTIAKGLLKGLKDLEVGGWEETIQMTALLTTDRILKESCRLKETCCHSNPRKKPSANTDVKNSKRVNNKNKMIKQRLEDSIQKHNRRLITATRNKINDTWTSGTNITRKQKLEGKQFHGSDEQATSHTRKHGQGYEKETLRE